MITKQKVFDLICDATNNVLETAHFLFHSANENKEDVAVARAVSKLIGLAGKYGKELVSKHLQKCMHVSESAGNLIAEKRRLRYDTSGADPNTAFDQLVTSCKELFELFERTNMGQFDKPEEDLLLDSTVQMSESLLSTIKDLFTQLCLEVYSETPDLEGTVCCIQRLESCLENMEGDEKNTVKDIINIAHEIRSGALEVNDYLSMMASIILSIRID